MSFYLGKNKAGFEVTDTQLVDTPEGKRLRVETESFLRIKSFGFENTNTSKVTSWYSLEGDGPLTSYHSVEVEDGTRTVMRGERKGDKFEVTTKAGKTTTTRTIEPPRERLRDWLDREAWLESGPAEGARFEFFLTDLEQDDPNRPATVVYRRQQTLELDGAQRTVHVAQLIDDGVKAEAEFLGIRRILRLRVAGLMEARNEPEKQARAFGEATADISNLSIVRVATSMGDEPAALEEVVLHVEGLQDLAPPTDHRQRLERVADGVAKLHLTREARATKATPLTDEQRQQHLRAAPGIESDHETIRNQAAEIIGSVTDPVAKAALLQRWVHTTLEGAYDSNAESALLILEKGAGDCTEHARLFVALARAAGVPAREVGGLLYAEQAGPCFVWHAWAQIHDGHQWLGVDPAWDQVGVDAGHLCMTVDTSGFEYINVMSSLRLTVDRFTRR